MRSLTRILVFILTATAVSSNLGIANGVTPADYIQAKSDPVTYRIDRNDMNLALDSTAVCTRTLDVDVKVQVETNPENVIASWAKNHEILLTNGTDILTGTNQQIIERVSGIEWQTISFTMNGCISPRWKSQIWAMSLSAVIMVKRKEGQFQTSSEGKRGIEAVVFNTVPNRSKPTISVLSVIPTRTSATLLLGAKMTKGDPVFTYEYRISGANTSKFPATWKEATGQVAKITSLKPKATYKLYVRAVAPDGTTGTSKLTSFKTK